ncbi:M61 family metallopeptidase [Flavisolibacter nicotianae]|uniref:M61 family metallopeptidase n=1 Tax=Flavisolibacter nicotianae TaxID=2364882 RepID=UPI0013C45BF4|nr:PDZ domain-containing protein [Flavisolibacter nicotianae]
MKSFLLFCCCIASGVIGFTQQIRYDFAAPNLAHHEAEISLTVTGLPTGPAFFRMSRSSPGRYATHEFAKNVYNVKAADQNGKALAIEKVDADVFRVAQHKGTVKVSYTLFGNYADGTYAEIDPTHLHLNMPATFLWVKGLDKAPITLRMTLPNPAWTIATQLKPTADVFTFTAPGLQYFMDSPIKAGQLSVREWKVLNPDQKTYTFRLALEADAKDTAVDAFANKVKTIVREAQAVFGEVPAYDYGTYTFLASISPYVKGDGMEHRNSTMITNPRPFINSAVLPGVFAHEFFHCWNVERIRPKSLEPFNFEKSNLSEALWIAEGFTQYYGLLLMKRAGFTSDADFYQQMAGLINAKENTPGGAGHTPVENSQMAVFVDAGVSIDRTNYPNMHTSYYYHGGALALALDLQLRQQFRRSMDDFMRELWKRFGKTERPYTLPEVEKALGAVSSPSFAATFFRDYVYHPGSVNYASLLKPAGLRLEKAAGGKAWLGNVRFQADRNGNLVIGGNTVRNTPLYNAGVDVDDVLLQLDGKELKSPEDVDAVLRQRKPGETLPLVFSHRRQKQEATVTLAEDPSFTVVPSGTIGEPEKAFQQGWYGSHATGIH